MDTSRIISLIVSPSIGIARMGNSPTGFFIGPEAPGVAPRPEGGFKDHQGRIKRQGARFRVYGLDAGGDVVGEITAAIAEIEWTVHLANRKAAWYQFENRYNFRPAPPLTNPDYLPWYPPVKLPDQYTALRNAKVADRASLVIDPGPRSISGRNASGPPYRFDGGTFLGTRVPLGELRTDEAGRLVVLGGFGRSASVIPNNPIATSSFNNDGWHDDTSDGPVTARVRFRDSGRELAASAARVVVAPPKYAPATANVVSLWERVGPASGAPGMGGDRLASTQEGLAVAAFRDGRASAGPDRVSFTRDVYPILKSATESRWVSQAAPRGHGAGMGGDFLSRDRLPALASNAPENARARGGVFGRIRSPRLDLDSDDAKRQASLSFMPPLGGDANQPTSGDARTFLRMSERQYAILEKWAAGDFDADWRGPVEPRVLDEYPLGERPAALTRAALEACVGGGFHPGIEITYIAEHPELYSAPFAFRPDIEPGGITKYMALPWQGDFFSCMTWWWPAQRPEVVVPQAEFELAFPAGAMGEPSPAEVVVGPAGDDNKDPKERIDAILSTRVPWERGLSDYYEGDPSLPLLRRQENAMVDLWSELGFVTPTKVIVRDPNATTGGAPEPPAVDVVFVERERAPLAGIDARELYFQFQNMDRFPDALPKARWLVEHYLQKARDLEASPDFPDAWHAFEYSKLAFAARLDQIYNDLVIEAQRYDPATDPLFRKRSDVVYWLTQMAPFNQNDGAWIHRVTPAGPLSMVDSLLFSVWMDEAGDGDMAQAHTNLFTELLRGLGIYFSDPRSRDYAEDPRFLDSAFIGPALALAISHHSETFFPEILGFSLQIEWTVLGIRPAASLLQYYGIDPHYYTLHIGIDNAAAGHGHRVRRAIEIYLDEQLQHGGQKAVEEQFRRIWNGFVAFGTAGTLGQDLVDALQPPPPAPTPADAVAAIMQAKQPYGSLNHGDKMVGPNRINNWFEDPQGFMTALVSAGYVLPGDPDHSRFFQLTSFDGPMYGVFTSGELDTFRQWTVWLKDGTPPPVVDYGVAMAGVIEALRGQQTGAAGAGHRSHTLRGKSPLPPYDTVEQTVAWWFAQTTDPGGVVAFMRALSDPANGWIVPGDPGASAFVNALLSSDNAMGRAYQATAPNAGDLTCREVAVSWIAAGCPIPRLVPGSARPRVGLFTGHHAPDVYPRRRILGMGSVH